MSGLFEQKTEEWSTIKIGTRMVNNSKIHFVVFLDLLFHTFLKTSDI